MTMTIIAGIAFLLHVAVWLGLPANRADAVQTEGMVFETSPN